MESEGSYDLVFPVPREGRSPAQQWWAAQTQPLFYLQGDWGVCGEAWVYDPLPIHIPQAELRFGEHHYMRGFRLCLAAQWGDDDKHEFEHPHAYRNVLSGMIRGCLVVFKPNPFQTMRLKRLMQAEDIPYLGVLVGSHMLECEKLIRNS